MDALVTSLRTACTVCIERIGHVDAIREEHSRARSNLTRMRKDANADDFPPELRLSAARQIDALYLRSKELEAAIASAETAVEVARGKVQRALLTLYNGLVGSRDAMCHVLEPWAKQVVLAEKLSEEEFGITALRQILAAVESVVRHQRQIAF
jgi:hypothetical protein